MEFETQAQLLRFLWKNENDRNLVQRKMIKGEVLKQNGMYILIDKDEIIKNLKEENEKLRSENVATKESNWDLEFYKVNCEYWEGLNNKKKWIIDNILNDIYSDSKNRGSTENYDDFITRMGGKYGYNPKED